MVLYKEDILGEKFKCAQIDLKPDYDGECICTLVKYAGEKRFTRSVLYIHGFSDYFFQKELAENFYNKGYNFYALDLRKSGRSILSWQKPYYVRDMSEYFEDIDRVCEIIQEETGSSFIICDAHSTGGLLAALYTDSNQKAFSSVILNSPFLEMNKGFFTKRVLMPLASCAAFFFPNIKIKKAFSPFYGQSVHKNYHGEWEFDTNIKPIVVPFVWSSWLRAIYNAHKRIKKGLNINVPVLVMHSSNSVYKKEWGEEFTKGDSVLNVADIDKYARKLGKNISIVTIENGMHDLILSPKPVRDKVYKEMFKWLND